MGPDPVLRKGSLVHKWTSDKVSLQPRPLEWHSVPLGILCAHPGFISGSLACEVQEWGGELSQALSLNTVMKTTLGANTSHLPWSSDLHRIFQSLAVPAFSEGDEGKGSAPCVAICRSRALTASCLWVPGSLRGCRQSFSYESALLLQPALCADLTLHLQTTGFVTLRSWSHTALELLPWGQEDLQGIKKWNRQFCQAFAVAKQRANNRNLCVLFNRMNDQVERNWRKLSDLGGMIKYSTIKGLFFIYDLCS